MPDGSIYGDNTDGVGLLNDLKHNHIQIAASRILVLGAGGATRGIVAPLLAQNPQQLVIANRTASKAIGLVQEFRSTVIAACSLAALSGRQFDLIINATSASLSDDLPELPENLLATGGSCYDLAYATQATSFVRWGIAQQAVKSLDGLGMLVEQAAEAFYVWRGVHPDTSTVINLLNAERFNKS
jgi:shikimate dehydrogenase